MPTTKTSPSRADLALREFKGWLSRHFLYGHPDLSVCVYVVGGELQLGTIYVPEVHRGRGEGSAIVGELLRIAKEYRIILRVEPTPLPGLLRWYRRLGFRPSEETGEVTVIWKWVPPSRYWQDAGECVELETTV